MVEIKTFELGFLSTNCYLVYNTETKTGFLIDPALSDRRISDTIEKNKITIKNIINTHGHMDHTGGNRGFGYPVLIHAGDTALSNIPEENVSRFLKDGDTVKEGGIAFEVIHTPGHTPGSISLKLGNKIFTGDTLFCESVGRADFPYSNQKDLFNSIKKRLMCFADDTLIFPGHGPSSTIGHERKHNPFLT